MRRSRRAGVAARLRHLALVEQLRASLWFVPALSVLAAAVSAAVLVRFDPDNDSWLSQVAFPGGAESARAILQTIAGSVITVTGVVFSLTVVTLQLASTQFSPRLLRTFLRDVSNQIVLGTFLATFTFCLVVLRAVASGQGSSPDRVPAVAVTGSYILSAASVVALVYFIDHIARAIRIDSLMREVNEDTAKVIEDLAARRGSEHQLSEETTAGGVAVAARRSGFVQAVDEATLVQVAVTCGCVIKLEPWIGARVVEGAPVAFMQFRAHRDDVSEKVQEQVATSVQIGYERTMQQDVAFGLRQLVDVAVKALSPGVNDPTTAMHAIGHLAHLLVKLSKHDLGARHVRDQAGDVRVIVPGEDFGGFLSLACDQIRRYGAAEPAVTAELLRLILDVARADVTGKHGDLLCRKAEIILSAAERHTDEPTDLVVLRQIHHEIEAVVSAARPPA